MTNTFTTNTISLHDKRLIEVKLVKQNKAFSSQSNKNLTCPEHNTPLVVPGAIQVSFEDLQLQDGPVHPALQTHWPHSHVP